MSAFEDHSWDCRRDRSSGDMWRWSVYRDNLLVGYLRSRESTALSVMNTYDAFDANGALIVVSQVYENSKYTNALRAIHDAAEGVTT